MAAGEAVPLETHGKREAELSPPPRRVKSRKTKNAKKESTCCYAISSTTLMGNQ
jgi:hypothetical protein